MSDLREKIAAELVESAVVNREGCRLDPFEKQPEPYRARYRAQADAILALVWGEIDKITVVRARSSELSVMAEWIEKYDLAALFGKEQP